ncbi:hypothetical protein PMIN01_00900 [Paraphaeosphaeria minitans]|uniref:Uncharacterized protein n=1 Tax=Paraphaeosphaeria minitans TaxID=565426 RepID=A0A9P6GTZ5_9PLEO|nr:hypothetical protein PMIN01_00900 [Paraphaeosphaeria minitans]
MNRDSPRQHPTPPEHSKGPPTRKGRRSSLQGQTHHVLTTTDRPESRGFYHGLPVGDASVEGLTALITGANGLSGYSLHVACASAESGAESAAAAAAALVKEIRFESPTACTARGAVMPPQAENKKLSAVGVGGGH